MGNLFASQPEDIKPRADMEVAEKVANIFRKGAKVLLENLGDLEPVPGPVKLSGKFASVILSEFTIDAGGLSMEKLLKEIKTVVRDGLSENEIDKVRGVVQVTMHWLRVKYKNRVDVESNWSKRDLYEVLSKKAEDEFEPETMKILTQERYITAYSGAAVAVFVLAANVYFSMLQDLARLDYRVNDPLQSAHAKDIRRLAQEYSFYVIKTTNKILAEREDKVRIKDNQPSRRAGSMGVNIFPTRPPPYIGYWKDEETGQYGRSYGASEEYKLDDEHFRRKVAVREHLHETMGRPKDAAELWKQLIDNPLGVTVPLK